MYSKCASGVAVCGGVAALPRTGVDVLWLIIGGIALIGVGFAILRFFPKKQH